MNKINLESDFEFLCELREVFFDQSALEGVFFGHDSSDSKKHCWNIIVGGFARLSPFGDLFHEGSVLATKSDVEVDNVEESGALKSFKEGLVGSELREQRDR